MGAVKAELGRLLGYEHVVLFGRARSALVAVIEETVHAGGPVIIPSNACSALLAAVLAAGRVPVVASVSAENGLVADEAFAATIDGWTDMPGLVLATHLYGMVADYPATVAAAKQKGWQLFENDSMASRAFLPDRTALGQGLVVSFGHGKPLDGGGGGALLTNDGALASALTRRVSAWPVFDAAADAVENHVVLARRHLYALGVPSATEPLLPIEAAHCRHAYDEAWCDALTHAISTFQDANSRKVERLEHFPIMSHRILQRRGRLGIRLA